MAIRWMTAFWDFPASGFEAGTVALGVEAHYRTEGWRTLRDPAGLLYCVTRNDPGVARLRSGSREE